VRDQTIDLSAFSRRARRSDHPAQLIGGGQQSHRQTKLSLGRSRALGVHNQRCGNTFQASRDLRFVAHLTAPHQA